MAFKKSENNLFEKAIQKTIRFLEKERIEYFILGGLAVGIMGEPRFTCDLDLVIFLKTDEVGLFLQRLKKASFKVDLKRATLTASQFGTFRVFYNKIQIDMIIASTQLEKEALQRKKRITFFGKKTSFPSPEDLILLKLIPGRPKDLIDAESIIIRNKNKLDTSYLENWAQRICEEAENFRILNQLKKMLEKNK